MKLSDSVVIPNEQFFATQLLMFGKQVFEQRQKPIFDFTEVDRIISIKRAEEAEFLKMRERIQIQKARRALQSDTVKEMLRRTLPDMKEE